MRTRSKILNTVIITNSVDVVKLISKITVVIHPYEVVNTIRFSVYDCDQITFWFFRAYRRSNAITFDRKSPEQLSIFISKQLVQSLLS